MYCIGIEMCKVLHIDASCISVAIFSLHMDQQIPQILWNDNEEDLNLFSDGGQVFHMLSNRLWYGILSHMFGFLAVSTHSNGVGYEKLDFWSGL